MLLIVLALIEIIIFIFYIAPENPVGEVNRGGLIRIPKFFNKIFTWYLPILLIILFCSWLVQDVTSANSIIFKNSLWSYLSKGLLVGIFCVLVILVYGKVYKK